MTPRIALCLAGTFVAAVVAPACSSSSSNGSPSSSSSSGGSGSSSGVSAHDAGGSGSGSGADSGSSSGSGLDASIAYVGSVALTVDAYSGTTSYLASAAFVTAAGGSNACVPSTATPCCYQSGSAHDAGLGNQTSASAGAIALTDGLTALGTLTFEGPDADADGYGGLSSQSSPALTWNPGDSLAIQGAGSTTGVDAFTGTLAAPSPLTHVTPALSFSTPTTVSISTPLALTWDAGPAGTSVEIALDVAVGIDGGLVTCEAAASAGAFTIPTSMLAMLPSNGKGELSVVPVVETVPTSPPANATMVLRAAGVGAAGSVTAGP